MTWWKPENFADKRLYLEQRMKLIRSVRRFFDEQDFYEVETPVLQVSPGMEPHLHAMKTDIRGKDLEHERTMYLHTSPEFAMKKLLVAGLPKIYQICHVFRDAEGSRLHSPEFTMLEWYRADAGYRDIMDDSINLLREVAKDCGIMQYRYRGKTSDPFREWEIITVCEAFRKYADFNLEAFLPPEPDPLPLGVESFRAAVKELGLHTADDDNWDDLFFRIFLERIEPNLGNGKPTIIYDYPAGMASLSRKKPDDPRFAERFEIYVCGMELANAFGELTDADEQQRRFRKEMELKQTLYGETYPIDEDFIAALEYGLPESGGIALGIDRLVMLASGAENISQVLWQEL